MKSAAHRVEIDVGPGAEVSIANQDFTVHESGLGEIVQKLAPDLYTLIVRVAGHTTEYDVVVSAGDDVRIVPDAGTVIKKTRSGVRIEIAQPAFASAAPLRETSRSHEYQGDFVERISDHPVDLLGVTRTGPAGEVLLSARAWKASSAEPSDLGLSVAVLSSDGEVVTDLCADGARHSQGDPIVAHAVRLPPGWYRLRIARRDRPVVEQSLVVCDGWQTQVFFLREHVPRDRMRVSVMMQSTSQRKLGKTMFQPGSDDPTSTAGPRMTELALLGLSRGRSVVDAEQLEEMLQEKFTDPMLGIYGAHLLGEKPQLLQAVVTNLRRLLRGTKHPDVEALALQVPALADSAAIEYPPMLTASWRNIISRSVKDPQVVPRGSLNAAIARRLSGTGVWLWWTTASGPLATAPTAGSAAKSRAALTAMVRQPPPLRAAKTAEQVSLLRTLPRDGVSSHHAPQVLQCVVETMGMPRTVVEDVAIEMQAPPRSAPRAPRTRSAAASRFKNEDSWSVIAAPPGLSFSSQVPAARAGRRTPVQSHAATVSGHRARAAKKLPR